VVTYIIPAVLLALVCLGSAGATWKKVPQIMQSHQRIGVTPQIATVIPICKTLGAAGLILGIFSRGLGAFAGFALTAYFVAAATFHFRAKDPAKEAVPAIALAVLSMIVAALALR
jgi:riboflavin transporter FmnP